MNNPNNSIENPYMTRYDFTYEDVERALPNNVINVETYYSEISYNPISFVGSLFSSTKEISKYTPRIKYTQSVIKLYCEMDPQRFQNEAEDLFDEATNFFDWMKDRSTFLGTVSAGLAEIGGYLFDTSSITSSNVLPNRRGNQISRSSRSNRVRRFPVYSEKIDVDNNDLVDYCTQNNASYDPNYYFCLNFSGSLNKL